VAFREATSSNDDRLKLNLSISGRSLRLQGAQWPRSDCSPGSARCIGRRRRKCTDGRTCRRVRPLLKLSVILSSPSFSLLRAIANQSSRGFQRSYDSHALYVQGLGEAQLGSIANVLERLPVSCQVISTPWLLLLLKPFEPPTLASFRAC
jgi:hypothetical protein